MNPMAIFNLLKDTFTEWNEDKAPQVGAALAYYTLFSIAPLLVVLIAVAGMVFGEETARGQVVAQVRGLVGDEPARVIQAMMQAAANRTAGGLGAVLGLAGLVMGATGVFGQLKDALNTMWEAPPKKTEGLVGAVKERVLALAISLAVLLGVGLLLLLSLLTTAVLSAFADILNAQVPGLPLALRALNLAVSFAFITLLFAMLYKVLPDVEIAWGDVWVGATVTALLFTLGKELIGLYIGRSNIASAYGAAGSLVVILVWVYYSAQILFLGAEFTQVYAKRRGSRAGASGAAGEPSGGTADRPAASPPPAQAAARSLRRRPAGRLSQDDLNFVALLGFAVGLVLFVGLRRWRG